MLIRFFEVNPVALVNMEQNSVKRAADCTVLIVDDDQIICDMLSRVLKNSCKTVATTSGLDAISLIDKNDFDVVITDLKMPDVTGIDVLECAKRKDEYTEVILMTGYGSLDTATHAINQGVNSYLLKPLQISEFTIQVEKAIASRLFHLRSIELMRQTDDFSPDVKLHVHEITSLYYFIRKLMLSLEIPEIMRITLDEVNCRIGAELSVITITLPGFEEWYVMPAHGEVTEDEVRRISGRFGEIVQIPKASDNGVSGDYPVIFKGRQGTPGDLSLVRPLSVPMMVADRMLGSVVVFVNESAPLLHNQNQYLYVFSSIVSSVIDHGYTALHARQQAKTDSLTGISNHRHFHETLDREVSRTNRKKNTFALILMDIDNFKRINDTYGHQVGDAVLIDMTARISAMIRAGDILARYGGEEFGLILPETALEGATALTSRILHAISAQSFTFAQHELFYTISIGLAIYHGENPAGKDELIAAADRALYFSKENGKNRLTVGAIA